MTMHRRLGQFVVVQRLRRGCAVGNVGLGYKKMNWSTAPDWDPESVNIGGIPSYDGYFRKQ
ncbi:MAG: hypothetical protein U0X87_13855 [Anaerolineales bacterium]